MAYTEVAPTMVKEGDAHTGFRDERAMVTEALHVRRLTPVECARLMGFPDNYLDIEFKRKPLTNGHKYKALGNSMAVPVMAWIGKQIKSAVEAKNG